VVVSLRSWLWVYATPFVGTALVFTVLIRTEDFANIRNFQYASSYLVLSLNPYPIFPFPPPPNSFAYFLPQFWVYQTTWLGYDSTIVLKIFGILGSLGLGAFVYLTARKLTHSSDKSRAALFAVLASPFLFFFTFVYVEQDVIPLALVLAGTYFLLPHTSEGRLPVLDLTLGTGLLVYGAFLYYFPIIVIWSLLVFSNSWRKSIAFVIAISSWTVVLYSTYAFRGFWPFFSNLSGTLQPAGKVPVFSVLNLFVPVFNSPFTSLATQVSTVFLAICAVLSIAIPILLRARRGSLFLSLSLGMALPFLFTKIYNADETVWVIPFVTLFLVTQIGERNIRFWLLLSQCWLVPVIVLFNMWTAAGYGAGTGVYYLTYTQFHAPIVIYNLFPDPGALSTALDLAAFSILAALCLVLVSLDRPRWRSWGELVKTSKLWFRDRFHGGRTSRPAAPNPPARFHFRPSIARRLLRAKGSTLAGSVFALAIVISLASPTTSQQISYTGEAPFPLGLFSSNPIPNPDVTYGLSADGRTLEISNASGPAGPTDFTRNLTGQFLSASVEMSVPLAQNLTFADPVAAVGQTTVLYQNQLGLIGAWNPIMPFHAENISSYNGSVPISSAPVLSLSNLSGYSIRQYSLNLTGTQPESIVLFFLPAEITYGQNLIFYSELPGQEQELFILGTTLYFGYKSNLSLNWTYVPETVPDGPFTWTAVLLQAENGTMHFSLDGLQIHTTPVSPGSAVNLNVGAFLPGDAYYHRYAFTGLLSELLYVPSTQLPYVPAIGVGFGNTTALTYGPILGRGSGNWSIWFNEGTVKLSGNEETFSASTNATSFSFGRYSSQSPALYVRFASLSIEATSSSGILLRVAAVSIGSLLWFLVMACERSIRHRSEERSRNAGTVFQVES
jgi:hypothetical protein